MDGDGWRRRATDGDGRLGMVTECDRQRQTGTVTLTGGACCQRQRGVGGGGERGMWEGPMSYAFASVVNQRLVELPGADGGPSV